ncbi:hypothetical protein [Thermogutta sp.]|uniref:hypothetical protein n=1 Tax=Thermogutta sp. TaxID=1962930 RepID=UPI00321FE07E
MHRPFGRAAAFALLVMALIASTIPGCGQGRPRLVKVSGQVFIDGQPLAAGVPGFIRVVPDGMRPATGQIDPQTGRFTLTTYENGDGCVPGTHKVAIILNAMVGQESVSLIDEKFANPETSGLTVTIEKPTDSLRIDITGPLKKVQATPISEDPNKF